MAETRTTASLLPLIPRIFFVYVEPIAISYGIYMNFAQQTPILEASTSTSPIAIPALFIPAQSASFLINMLLYGLAVLLLGPPSKSLLKAHIWILIIADFTHWSGLFATLARARSGGNASVMEWDWAGALVTKNWDAEMWNLATYPIGTLAIKFATLAGIFGRIRG